MNTREIVEFARKVPLFTCLGEKDIRAVSSVMVVREFGAGDTIVHEDDEESHTFFIIVSGTVHAGVMTPEGKKTILATMRKGDFFGEMSLLDGEPRSASVVAAGKCVLLMLYRKPFLEILRKYPQISIQMLVEMSRRLRNSNRHINTLSLMSVYGRVADVLLRLARDQGLRSGTMIVISDPPTHQTIADMAGTSRETVSRVLSQLRKKQLIGTDRKKMVILDEEKLYH
jgi:CRP/FNR family transcriptional regulator/CRP/FNR family cyclic AMP-dependent transcriptional regulator